MINMLITETYDISCVDIVSDVFRDWASLSNIRSRRGTASVLRTSREVPDEVHVPIRPQKTSAPTWPGVAMADVVWQKDVLINMLIIELKWSCR